MIRLFVDSALKKDLPLTLTDQAVHYLLHVMRQKVGNEILCFNGKDGEWQCFIEELNKKNARIKPVFQTRLQETPEFCALCPALIKKDNLDLVIQKATELGVTDIFPLITRHTVVTYFNKERAFSIAQEAAEQSERLSVPHIHDPASVLTVVSKLPTNCTLYYLSERGTKSDTTQTSNTTAFFIGPEGGWHEEELSIFKKEKRFHELHLKGGILRAETACIAILSCWQLGRFLNWKK